MNHPIRVVALLWDVGGVRDTAALVGALLHDTLEDTPTTPEGIEKRFGREVRVVVEEVTDDKALPKGVRKELQVSHAPRLSPQAKLIKLADKIDNVQELSRDPPEGWSRQRILAYVDWAEQVVEGLRGVNDALEMRWDEVVADARLRFEDQRPARAEATVAPRDGSSVKTDDAQGGRGTGDVLS